MKMIINSKQAYQNKTLVSPSAQKFYEPVGTKLCPTINKLQTYHDPFLTHFNDDFYKFQPTYENKLANKHYTNGYGSLDSNFYLKNSSHQLSPSNGIESNNFKSPSQSHTKRSYKRLLGMITLCLVDFSAATCFSIIGPFFPTEAEKKGVNKFWVGAIFGTFQGIQFLVSPFLGLYMYKIGVKRLYLVGIGVNAIAIFAFGFTTYLPTNNSALFVWVTFALRTLEGVGCAAYLTSSYLFTLNIYPDNVGIVFGILETFAGLGFAIGPAFGGVLYMVGGYMLPFLGVSISLMVLLVAAIYLLPPISDIDGDHPHLPIINEAYSERNEKCALLAEQNADRVRVQQPPQPRILSRALAFLHLFKLSPTVWLDYMVLVVGALSVGFVDPTLEPHLRARRLGLTTAGVGAIFVALSATYALSAMLLGRLMDNPNLAGPKLRRALLCSACALSALGLLASGPSPLLNFSSITQRAVGTDRTRLLATVCLAQILMGAALGCVVVVTFADIMAVATDSNTNSTPPHALVSGLYTSALALGSFLGPILGGCLTVTLNYEWSATVISSIAFAAFLVSLLATAYQLGKNTI